MRNLDECQAEVFRRSEKRIKERRQRRKHMLMACIPVAAVGLCAALALPGLYGPTKTADAASGAAGDFIAEMTDSVVEIQVEGVNICYTYSASTEIQSITGQFEDFSTRAPTSGASCDEVQENIKEETTREDDSNYPMEDAASPRYAITLTLEDGGKVEYYLLGNILENRTEGEVYSLTQEQLEELKSLLGIGQP